MFIKTNKNITSNSDMYIKINYKKCIVTIKQLYCQVQISHTSSDKIYFNEKSFSCDIYYTKRKGPGHINNH